MPFAETSRLFVPAIHPDSIAIAASLPILKSAAETTSLPIKESAAKLRRCRFLYRQRKLGRCRFLYRQRRLHRCRSRIGSGTASLPIHNRQRNHTFLTRPSIRTPLAKANHSLSRPSIRMPLAEANQPFILAIHSDAISRS